MQLKIGFKFIYKFFGAALNKHAFPGVKLPFLKDLLGLETLHDDRDTNVEYQLLKFLFI